MIYRLLISFKVKAPLQLSNVSIDMLKEWRGEALKEIEKFSRLYM